MKITDKYGDTFEIEPEKLSGQEIGLSMRKTLDRFQMDKTPYIPMAIGSGKDKTITITKHCSTGKTESILDNVYMKSVQCGMSYSRRLKLAWREDIKNRMINDINKKRCPGYVLESLEGMKS